MIKFKIAKDPFKMLQEVTAMYSDHFSFSDTDQIRISGTSLLNTKQYKTDVENNMTIY